MTAYAVRQIGYIAKDLQRALEAVKERADGALFQLASGVIPASGIGYGGPLGTQDPQDVAVLHARLKDACAAATEMGHSVEELQEALNSAVKKS